MRAGRGLWQERGVGVLLGVLFHGSERLLDGDGDDVVEFGAKGLQCELVCAGVEEEFVGVAEGADDGDDSKTQQAGSPGEPGSQFFGAGEDDDCGDSANAIGEEQRCVCKISGAVFAASCVAFAFEEVATEFDFGGFAACGFGDRQSGVGGQSEYVDESIAGVGGGDPGIPDGADAP